VRSIRTWPWPFLLLLIGAGVASTRVLPPITVSSAIILVVFLPPLLFDAGFSMQGAAVRRELRWILLLGLVGSVVAGALAFAFLLAARFPAGEALLLSAVLAATDPISVFAALRRLRTPPRLRVALEGESLVNDAVAVVLFVMAVAVNQTGGAQPLDLTLLFFRLVVVGLGVGVMLGIVTRRALRVLPRWSDIPLTIASSYLAYLASDRLGGSGLLSVILLALVLGAASHSPAHHHVHRFWRQLGFIMASVVFLIVGLQVRVDAIAGVGGQLAILVVAIWLARLLMVLLVTSAAPRQWPWSLRAALSWAGLRGALSLALALGIPPGVPQRTAVLALVVGFIVISLAVQGLSIGPVFRLLGVGGAVAVTTAR
jgi:CPA1 family monovalent cation:H+ antiporter